VQALRQSTPQLNISTAGCLSWSSKKNLSPILSAALLHYQIKNHRRESTVSRMHPENDMRS